MTNLEGRVAIVTTYKRQAYSACSFERSNSEHSRFVQTSRDGEEWPFVSDYGTDMAALQAQQARERAARQRPEPPRD